MVANLKDGGVQFRVLDREDIDRIKKSSKTNNIWNDHFEEMAKKQSLEHYLNTYQLAQSI